jgi:thioredoxin-dependent peroxiredoxin
MALSLGAPAPDFTLPNDKGETVSLSSLRGKKVVLFFYPKADTPGCTLESIAFSRLNDEFTLNNVVVLGASADEVKKQAKFRDKYELGCSLISDVDKSMLEAYGVWIEKSMYGKKYMGIDRTTFLIDELGNISYIWNKVKPENHAEEVLLRVKS